MQQLSLNLPYATSYHPADFVVSDCNSDAMTYVKSWREWPSYGVCVIGAKQSGKTHLCAVYHAEIPTAILLKPDSIKRKNIFDTVGTHIIIDDADEVKDETAFFHLINLVKNRKGSMFLTAKIPPSQWKIKLPDLKSRLCALPIVRLQNANNELLYGILLKLFSDRQIFIDDDLARYVLKYINGDIYTIKKCVDLLESSIIMDKKPLSKLMFRKILFDNTIMMNNNARIKFLGV